MDYRSATLQERQKMDALMAPVVAWPDNEATVIRFGQEFFASSVAAFDGTLSLMKRFDGGLKVLNEILDDVITTFGKNIKGLGDPSFAQDMRNAEDFLNGMTVDMHLMRDRLLKIQKETGFYIGAGNELLRRYADGTLEAAESCPALLAEHIDEDFTILERSCIRSVAIVDDAIGQIQVAHKALDVSKGMFKSFGAISELESQLPPNRRPPPPPPFKPGKPKP